MNKQWKLRPYQIKGVEHLNQTAKMILADDMGLGKTLQVVMALPLHVKALIICPKSIIPSWLEHLETRYNTDDIYILASGKDTQELKLANCTTHAIIITNYETVLHNIDIINSLQYSHVVIDEAHRLKNRKAKTTIAIKTIETAHLWLLTGTPIHLEPADTYSLLNLLNPTKYKAFWSFVKTYCYVNHNGWGWEVKGCSDPAGFAHELQPYILRRTKEEVLPDLPEKICILVNVPMPTIQRDFYNLLVKAITNQYQNLPIEDRLRTLTASFVSVRQATLNPELLNMGFLWPQGVVPPKAEYILNYIQDSGGASIVIFSYFKKWINYLYDFLTLNNISCALVTGDTSNNARIEAIHNFTKSDTPRAQVFLSTIRAGGEGLNLQIASHLIFTDLDYNHNVNLQAESRIHRIGTKTSPCIIRLTCPQTIDSTILALNERRMLLNKHLLHLIEVDELDSITDMLKGVI